jgi:signal transduction histidine kinase
VALPVAFEESHSGPGIEDVRRSASRWRWALAIAVGILVCVIWATWFEITKHEERQAMASAARRQANLAVSVGQYLTRAFGNADAVGQYLASIHPSSAPDFSRQLEARARANSLFTEMIVCFSDGTLLATGGWANAPDRAGWCSQWLREAPPDARTYPGEPVHGSRSTVVPLLTRTPAGADRPAALIALLVGVRSLLGLMEEYSIPDETVILVAGSDGRPRARWHSAAGTSDQRAPEIAVLPVVLAARTLGQLQQVGGRPILASARRMPAYPMTVLITTSLADTLAEPHERSVFYGTAAAIATVLVVVFALLLLRLQNQALRSAESLGRARLRLQALNDDLEEQVRVRTAELERAYRDLEAFSYTVAHDVRAPIAAIQGFADALAPAVHASGDPRASHYLRRIAANATQMNQFAGSLLELGKLSRPAMERRPIDLSALAHEVLEGLRERDGRARAVESKVQEGLFVQGDCVLVRQVLENLLGNAWKFSAARAPALIGVTGERDDQGWITIAIRDNGEGFDQAAAVGLFTPFRRMHAPDAFPGTGVGLAMVDRILRLHGGRTWIESSPASGTTVYFCMRAATGDLPAAETGGQ